MIALDNQPIVTVIIPCFNQARFLSAAVASVRAQTYPHVACIVVNDGSTDGTAVAAEQLGIQLLTQPNRGVAHARNAGLAATRSEFVVFLDADDELLPGAIAIGVKTMRSQPSVAAVVGRCQLMDTAGRRLPAVYRQVDASRLYREWLAANFVWTIGAAMFRSRALAQIGAFPTDVAPAADYAVYLRLARAGRVAVIAEELARYRRHDTSMSRDPALMLRATLDVLKRESLEAPPAARPWIRRGRRRWCEWYGDQIIDGLRADWRAARRDPSQAQALALLIRHCPRVVVRHVLRKVRHMLTAARQRARTSVAKVLSDRRVAP